MKSNFITDSWIEYVNRRNVPLLFVDLMYDGLYPKQRVNEIMGFDIEYSLLLKTPNTYYCNRNEFNDVINYLSKLCTNDLIEIERKINSLVLRFDKLDYELSAALSMIKSDNLILTWMKFKELITPSLSYLMIKHPLGVIVEDLLEKELRKHGKASDFNSLKVHLTSNMNYLMFDMFNKAIYKWKDNIDKSLKAEYNISVESFNSNEVISFILSLKNSNPKFSKIWNDLVKLYEKFYWKNATYWNNEIFTLNQFVQTILSVKKIDKNTDIPIEVEKLLEIRKIKLIVSLLGDLQSLHTWHVELLFRAQEKIFPLFKLSAENLRISVKELTYLRFSEIIDSIKSKDLDSIIRAKISSRLEHYSIYKRKDLVEVYEEDLSLHISMSKSIEKKLFGRIAYPGNIKGKARVINKPNQIIANVAKDEILVVKYTTIEWDQYILSTNIAGIITEEGGITSHAAKIAKEGRIPCIVGVKGLLASIKTGDEISFDPNNGIVTIIKKK